MGSRDSKNYPTQIPSIHTYKKGPGKGGGRGGGKCCKEPGRRGKAWAGLGSRNARIISQKIQVYLYMCIVPKNLSCDSEEFLLVYTFTIAPSFLAIKLLGKLEEDHSCSWKGGNRCFHAEMSCFLCSHKFWPENRDDLIQPPTTHSSLFRECQAALLSPWRHRARNTASSTATPGGWRLAGAGHMCMSR